MRLGERADLGHGLSYMKRLSLHPESGNSGRGYTAVLPELRV
jgi:hypothetical protein